MYRVQFGDTSDPPLDVNGACLSAGGDRPDEQRLIWLAVLACPMTLLGAWAGTRVYRSLSDTHFRDLVLGLLFLSGVGLVWSGLR